MRHRIAILSSCVLLIIAAVYCQSMLRLFSKEYSTPYARVYVNNGISIIDAKGETITGGFKWAFDYSGGIALVTKGEGWFFIDKKGHRIIKESFDAAQPFSDGWAAVNKDGYWRFINRNCEYLGGSFEHVFPFSEGLAAVKNGGKYTYIDTEGAIGINAQFEAAGFFIEGIAPVILNGESGYINTKGVFTKGDVIAR